MVCGLNVNTSVTSKGYSCILMIHFTVRKVAESVNFEWSSFNLSVVKVLIFLKGLHYFNFRPFLQFYCEFEG